MNCNSTDVVDESSSRVIVETVPVVQVESVASVVQVEETTTEEKKVKKAKEPKTKEPKAKK